ncbi:MAG TPA: hypothetical protein VGF28_10740 [Thermoanaerobaculia bacterium]|jgi:hypothetical protein
MEEEDHRRHGARADEQRRGAASSSSLCFARAVQAVTMSMAMLAFIVKTSGK